MMQRKESGQVAMMMVAVFTAVFTVLTVGLSFVTMSTVRNSTNDNLTYNARTAADAGVEDAKRLLKYCLANDPIHDPGAGEAYKLCDVLYSTVSGRGCNDTIQAIKNSTAPGLFKLNVDNDNGSWRVRVTNDKSPEALQYYQCLKVNTLTRTFEGVLSNQSTGGRSVVVPLKFVNAKKQRANAARIVVSWHKLEDKPSGDGKAEILDGTDLPKLEDWRSSHEDTTVPAVMRAQFTPSAKTNIKINDMMRDNRIISLRPTKSGWGGSVNVFSRTVEKEDLTNPTGPMLDLQDYTMSDQPNKSPRVPLAGAICTDSGAAYACSTSLTYRPKFDTVNRYWFLRLTAIYNNTHFRITAYDEHNEPLWFDGVQPSVDVTGKSAESYVRVKARLAQNSDFNDADLYNWWPEYAIDTGGDICKDIVVKYSSGEIKCN